MGRTKLKIAPQTPGESPQHGPLPCLTDRNFFPLITKLLQQGTQVRFRVTGNSMTPFLQSNDVVTAAMMCTKDLEIGDVLLVDDHQKILVHRLVKKTGSSKNRLYITKGDNVGAPDAPVKEAALRGKIRQIERKTATGRSIIDMESWHWKKINLALALISRLRSNCNWLSRIPFEIRLMDRLCRACFFVFTKR